MEESSRLKKFFAERVLEIELMKEISAKRGRVCRLDWRKLTMLWNAGQHTYLDGKVVWQPESSFLKDSNPIKPDR